MSQKNVRAFLVLNLILTTIIGGLLLKYTNTKPDFSNDVIKTRGVIVTDSFGVERIIISAPLPDPTYAGGHRLSRDGEVSGILLFDSEGIERSGYVTDNDYGNVLFTLDSKSGQHVLFISEPQGGATLMMFDKNDNKVVLGAYEDGVDFRMVNNGKELKFTSNEN